MIRLKILDKIIFPLALALVVSIAGLAVRIAVPTAAQPQPEGIELPVAMYHHILKEEARLNKYTISPDEFRSDMQYLKDSGYTPIVIQDLLNYVQDGVPLPEKPVMITFDDGYESFHEYAFPILKEFGFKSVFSVVGTLADQYSEVDDHHIRYSHCTWNQLGLLHESGLVEIQNHSYNLHINDKGRHGSKMKSGESALTYQNMLLEDLGRLQAECAEHLDGYQPACFTYPFGQISKEALPVIKQLGFKAALTCEEKLNYITGDPEQLYHLRRFNRPHGTSIQTIFEKAQGK
ncbi:MULTISPECIES: polysaccharide deacetylase family protein [Anaerotruncus]|uniref:polysaccharide deacetylase family protein n=2 Tax=Oscillospiraceae TaxID=216572 RepID=UPI001FA8ADC4|nr:MULTISPECIES: polysaccharide deacetylase family protein [Anaerotruncus]